jgi:hypothetical protein
MSTKLHDLPNNAVLGQAVTPRVLTATVTGPAIDLGSGDGRCFSVQLVGTVTGTTPSLAGKIQESPDGATNWADISGATFAAVTSSDNQQAISFDRTQRYVRYIGTVTGTTPNFPVAVLIGEQKKQV